METPETNSTETEIPILMLGLNDAGKTTILYKLLEASKPSILYKLFKWQKRIKTNPTIGFNFETIEFEGQKYSIWDIGGCEGVRDLWKLYSAKKSVVIFVVDASAAERLTEAKEFLHNVMSNENQCNDILLLISHKHDKPNCLDVMDLEDQLVLKSLKQSYRIVETSAYYRDSLNAIMLHLRDIHLCSEK